MPMIPTKLITLLAVAAGALSPSVFAQYHESAKFKIGGDASRVDYLVADTVNRHLFIAHDKKFEVLDIDSGKKVGEIGPTSRAHGIAVAPEFNHGFATSGNTSTIIMFDLKTLKTLSVIKSSGTNPDGVNYDPETKKVYVANGSSGNMTIIDPDAGTVVGTVQLLDPKDAKLEAMAFDGAGRCFVNDEEKSSMHTFDTHSLKVGDTWSLAPGEGGTGLAIDKESHRLFASCANQKLVVVNSETGKVVATPPIGDDPDAVAFDPESKNIFVSNSDSTMTILHEDTPDTYSVVQTVDTGKGAKTSCVSEGKIYLPIMKFGPAPAPTKAVPEPRPPVIAGTLQILVLSK
jgi:DNA-binding beta-propeller fold protein YncE